MSEHKYKDAYSKGFEAGKKQAFTGYCEQCYDELSPYEQTKLMVECGADIPTQADAISRQTVLDKIKEVCFSREQEWVDFRVSQGSNGQRNLIIKFIEDLPSIQPKQKTDVLDKIKAEIHATAEMHEDGDYYLRDEWIDEIFDKYKAEE